VDEPLTRAEKRAATSRRIVEAARAEFAASGFEAATVRKIARRAGVDPSLVLQHYGSKRELFAVAADLNAQSSRDDVASHLSDVLKVRLRDLPPSTAMLLRSMLTDPETADTMRGYLEERAANLARTSGDPKAELRAAVAVSSIMGLTIARHLLRLDALTDVSDADIEDVIEPMISGVRDAGTTGAD
jgi:AcrR family transcriptional regulator